MVLIKIGNDRGGVGWVGVNYGYWIIDPHLGTFLWPPTSVYAL